MPKTIKISPHQIKRNKRIVEEFNRLIDIKVNGAHKFSIDYVYSELEDKFYLDKGTLQRIVKGTYHTRAGRASGGDKN